MRDEKSRPGEETAFPKVIAATVDIVPCTGDIPAILPRRRVAVSEFRRLRRDRAVYVAGQRRDRGDHHLVVDAEDHRRLDSEQRGAQIDHAKANRFLPWEIAVLVPGATLAERERWAA